MTPPAYRRELAHLPADPSAAEVRAWIRAPSERWRVRFRQQAARRYLPPEISRVAGVMRPHRRLRPFVGESEAAALVERYALGTWQRAASELAYGCCLDGAALAALVLDDLDLDGGWVTSRGVARPLGRLAREAVTAYLASGGGPRRGGRSILPSLRHVKAAVPARLLAFSAAVHMVRRGADVVTVGVLLGYTSPGSASRALGAFSVTARDIPSTWRKRG